MSELISEIFDTKRLNLLLGFAYSFLGSKEDAEDVVQEVIAKVLGKPFFPIMVRNVDAFLIRSVRNACIDFLRTRKIHTSDFDGLEASGSPDSWSDRDLLLAAMAGLSDKQREIVYLKDVYGYHTEEIAGMLGVSDG